MNFLPAIAVVLPQILVFLLIGSAIDLLGGFNKADTGFDVLIILFLLNPVVTLILLITEMVKYRKHRKTRIETPSFFMLALALFLFVEALVTNVFILSQVSKRALLSQELH